MKKDDNCLFLNAVIYICKDWLHLASTTRWVL